MFKHYYVNNNEQKNGDHEVHASGCDWLPDLGNRSYLGYFSSCAAAVNEAKKIFKQSNGCYYCSKPCHTQ